MTNTQKFYAAIEEINLLGYTIVLHAKDNLTIYIFHKDKTDFSQSNNEHYYWRAGLAVPFFINVGDITHYPEDEIDSFVVSGINKTSEAYPFDEFTFENDLWKVIKKTFKI